MPAPKFHFDKRCPFMHTALIGYLPWMDRNNYMESAEK